MRTRKQMSASAGKATPVQVRIQESDLAALDLLLVRQGDRSITRPELIRRVLIDRLVHEKLLPSSRAYSGHGSSEGTRPEQLTSENDD